MSNHETAEIQDLIKKIETEKKFIENIKSSLYNQKNIPHAHILKNNLKTAEMNLKKYEEQLKALQAEEETQAGNEPIQEEPINEILQKKPLAETITPTSLFIEKKEMSDEYIDEPTEEEEYDNEGIDMTEQIKAFDDMPEPIAEDVAQLEELEQPEELEPLPISELFEELPAPAKEPVKALMKAADRIVAKEEPEKNLALVNNMMSYLPSSIVPYVADSVASTLMDAKDENGKPIFESKNEIIKLLKDLRNSKLRKATKSGNRGGKTKSHKNKNERDYLDYMYSKQINPALLITPKMWH